MNQHRKHFFLLLLFSLITIWGLLVFQIFRSTNNLHKVDKDQDTMMVKFLQPNIPTPDSVVRLLQNAKTHLRIIDVATIGLSEDEKIIKFDNTEVTKFYYQNIEMFSPKSIFTLYYLQPKVNDYPVQTHELDRYIKLFYPLDVFNYRYYLVANSPKNLRAIKTNQFNNFKIKTEPDLILKNKMPKKIYQIDDKILYILNRTVNENFRNPEFRNQGIKELQKMRFCENLSRTKEDVVSSNKSKKSYILNNKHQILSFNSVSELYHHFDSDIANIIAENILHNKKQDSHKTYVAHDFDCNFVIYNIKKSDTLKSLDLEKDYQDVLRIYKEHILNQKLQAKGVALSKMLEKNSDWTKLPSFVKVELGKVVDTSVVNKNPFFNNLFSSKIGYISPPFIENEKVSIGRLRGIQNAEIQNNGIQEYMIHRLNDQIVSIYGGS